MVGATSTSIRSLVALCVIRAVAVRFMMAFAAVAPIAAQVDTSKDSTDGPFSVADTAALQVVFDTSAITPAPVPVAALDDYRSDRDFIYDRTVPAQSQSIWDGFMEWLRELFWDAVPTGGGVDRSFWNVAAWAGLILVVIVIIAVSAGVRGALLRSSALLVSDMKAIDENIHEIDFERAIEQAIAEGRYKRAVRLLYLKALKGLTDRALIEWRIDKTNHDYARELRATYAALLEPFQEATLAFEYAWYGDMPIDAESFPKIRMIFSQFDVLLTRIPIPRRPVTDHGTVARPSAIVEPSQ